VLAAGIDAKHAPSVPALARMLHLPQATVIAREKVALRQIQGAQRGGRCTGAPGAIPVSALPSAPQTLVLLGGPATSGIQFAQAARTKPLRSFIAYRLSHRRPRLGSRQRLHGSAVLAESALRVAPGSGWTLEAWLIGILGLLAIVGAGLLTRQRAGRRRITVAQAVAAPPIAPIGMPPPSVPNDPWWPATVRQAPASEEPLAEDGGEEELPPQDAEEVPASPTDTERLGVDTAAPATDAAAIPAADAAAMPGVDAGAMPAVTAGAMPAVTSPASDAGAPSVVGPQPQATPLRRSRSRQVWLGLVVAGAVGAASLATRAIHRVRRRRRRWWRLRRRR
jgi:hypothetical protein